VTKPVRNTLTVSGSVHAIVTTQHRPDCRMREWCCPRSIFLSGRDRTGRTNPTAGTISFLHCRCNDPQCPAELLINERELMQLLGDFGAPPVTTEAK
jgi:hypothetical protein